jgi:hypothetical protein
MVTFDEARAVVDVALRPDWPADAGELVVLPGGREDADSYLVIAGAREYLEHDDPDFARLDAPALLVDKATGDLRPEPVVDVLDRLDAMTPIGPQ